MKFASEFSDLNILPPLVAKLTWSHFIELFPLKSIESKMPKGSIIMIDDNYIKGTHVQWFYGDGREDAMSIKYPMVGKGAHIYQHVLNNETDWKLIGTHYDSYDNIKIIIQKK